jgi:hypothetical protein
MANLEYNYLPPEGETTRHMWTAIGDKGAIHIWAEPVPSEGWRWPEEYYGGVEKHSKTPVYDFNSDKPDHEECWLLKCPCWHDGSSLYFSERIEPLLRHVDTPFPPHINEYMNAIMLDWYRSHFEDRFSADAAE